MTDQEEFFVQFKNVQKSYDGEILVVKDFNLDIRRGEFLTMLGPSGSGKTTCRQATGPWVVSTPRTTPPRIDSDSTPQLGLMLAPPATFRE
jgi:ABC-type glutathione transport system ATPase component